MFPLKIVQYKHIIQISSISSNSIKFSFLTILSKNYQTCILSYNMKFKNFNPNTNFQHDETTELFVIDTKLLDDLQSTEMWNLARISLANTKITENTRTASTVHFKRSLPGPIPSRKSTRN